MNKKIKWNSETLQKEAAKFTTKAEFRNNNKYAFNIAKKQNILETICTHMIPNAYNIPWTIEELKKEALLYGARNDFKKGNEGAYATARKHGIIEEICSHMKSPKRKYTEEELREAAKPFNTRRRFKLGEVQKYKAALRYGKDFMDDICSHMKKSKGTSIEEEKILSIVRQYFSQACKKRFYNKDKEKYKQIFFELDIFIPELNIGIEFDGEYWHSDAILQKRAGINAKEYHERKDNFFNSLGIKVLHVKEKNWEYNKIWEQRTIEFFLGILPPVPSQQIHNFHRRNMIDSIEEIKEFL